MRPNLKSALMIAVFLSAVLPFSLTGYAQSAVTPMVVPGVAVEPSPLTKKTDLIVVELFSSQACVFCPQADALFSELILQPHVIGLACHVDYFDVRAGSLSQPFCTSRQSWYMQVLGAGPNYTPQIVINGYRDMVGYKAEDVRHALHKAQETQGPDRLEIVATGISASFKLSWSTPMTVKLTEPAALWLAVFDKPHNLIVAEGRNKGTPMRYENIVSRQQELGVWSPAENAKTIEVKLTPGDKGFAVFIQGQQSGRLYAAGQYMSP